jgi:tetratricopeptide (TPR) repeat protein
MNKRFQDILNLAQSGQLTSALQKCDLAIKKKPKDINLALLAASIHAQSQQYDRVIHYCLRALKVDPRNTSALYNLSIAYLFIEDYTNTIKYSLKLIKRDKKHASAYANLGLAYWHTGDLEKAKDNALTSLKLKFNNATNHNNLGLIYKSLKDTKKSIEHFEHAIKLDSQLAEAYYNYAMTILETDDDKGQVYLDKALQLKPDYPEALNFKGLTLLKDKQSVSRSIDYFKKAISYKSDYSEAYCNLGNAYMTEKQFPAAVTMFKKAIEYNPEFASAYNNLGNALFELDNYRRHFKEAEKLYLTAIELAPELNETYKNLALCYQSMGDNEKSLEYFNIYDRRVPDDETVIASVATIYEHTGRFDEGMSTIEPFIKNDDVSTEIVLTYAKLARHFKHENEAIKKLIKVDDDNIGNDLRVKKYFTLGGITESLNDVETTFRYYKMANDFQNDTFDIAHERSKFDNIKAYFTKELIKSERRSKNTSRLPIFIVGMPRSGTSLAEQVLASHPDVYGAGELENIYKITQKIDNELEPKGDFPQCIDNMYSEYATKISDEHVHTLQQMSPGSKYVVDKMPHNFMQLGLINLLFPNSTIIHCRRSSVDTCLSIYFQHFNKDHSYSNSLSQLGEYYNLYADMMEHWKTVLNLNFIELDYEKMISDTEAEVRSLLECCGIGWDPACLRFHENKRTVMTPSYDQVRRPIYTSSVAKWKKYEHHIAPLLENLGDRAY